MHDDDRIAELLRQAFRAWGDGDARGYGACFTPDCDYVSFDGYHAHGQEAVIEAHDKLFRGVLYGSRLIGEVESIRYLSDDIALVHATGSVLVAWRNRLPKRRLTRLTMIAVRGQDGWRFTATHNGRIRPVSHTPIPPPCLPSPRAPSCAQAGPRGWDNANRSCERASRTRTRSDLPDPPVRAAAERAAVHLDRPMDAVDRAAGHRIDCPVLVHWGGA